KEIRPTVPRSALLVSAATLCLLMYPRLCGAQTGERLTFIGVALDQASRQADRKLAEYLQVKAGVSFAPEELEYERVIERLVTWRKADGYYLARTTPYAYV